MTRRRWCYVAIYFLIYGTVFGSQLVSEICMGGLGIIAVGYWLKRV